MSKKQKALPGLVPAFAVERFGKPIQQAQAEAIEAAVAFRDGERKAAEARAEAHAAPAADAERLADAVKKGKKPPRAKAADAERDAEAAEAAVEVLREERNKARQALHRAVIAELPQCIQIQNAEICDLRDQAAALLAELRGVAAQLELEGAVADGLSGADEFRVRRGKRVHAKIGKLSFSRSRRSTRDVLARAEEAIEPFGPVTGTAAEAQEADERRREANRERHSQMRQIGEGGVYVDQGGLR